MAPPSIRSFDLNLLVLFDALYGERKLSTAARAIGLSQPAASQALARLRRSFDDELFERRGRGMEPTPQAHALAPAVRQALSVLEGRLRAMQDFDPSTSERTFVVSLAELGETVLLPRLVAKVRREAPHVRLHSVRETRDALLESVRRKSVEMAIDFKHPLDDEFRFRRIVNAELTFIARRDHPRLNGRISFEHFKIEEFVGMHLDEETHGRLRSLMGLDGQPRGLHGVQVSHLMSIPDVVLASDAVSIFPSEVIDLEPRFANGLQRLVAPFPLVRIPVFLYWHESLQDDAGHAWLRRCVADMVGIAARHDGVVD